MHKKSYEERKKRFLTKKQAVCWSLPTHTYWKGIERTDLTIQTSDRLNNGRSVYCACSVHSSPCSTLVTVNYSVQYSTADFIFLLFMCS